LGKRLRATHAISARAEYSSTPLRKLLKAANLRSFWCFLPRSRRVRNVGCAVKPPLCVLRRSRKADDGESPPTFSAWNSCLRSPGEPWVLERSCPPPGKNDVHFPRTSITNHA